MSESPQYIKAILLDFDGVLRHWPLENNSVEDSHGLPRGSINDIAFARENLDPVIRGTMIDEEWRSLIASELLRAHPQSDAEKAVRRWSEPVGRIDLKVLDIVLRYFPDARLVLATNATSRLNADLQQLGIQDAFFGIANSSELKVIKPEEDYYLAALAIAQTDPEQVIYIDDDSENVQVARKMGIRSHQFKTIEGMTEFFENLHTTVPH